MAEETTTTVETPPNEDEIDLEELIGNVLENRGFTADRATKLDLLDTLGEGFSAKVEELKGLFSVGKPTGASTEGGTGTPDFDGFLTKVGEIVDAKLSAFTPGAPATEEKKKRPLLQRMLGVPE